MNSLLSISPILSTVQKIDPSVQVAVVGAFSSLLVVMVRDYYQRKKEERERAHQLRLEQERLDVINDIELEEKNFEILSDIQRHYNCDVLAVWGFHNGTKFFNGRHDLKMSMISEWVNIGIESGMGTMKNIGWKEFKRFIIPLKDTDTYISYETQESDRIAIMHQHHNIDTIVTTRLMQENRLVGVLVMKFSDRREFTENDLQEFKFNAARIENNF